MDLEQLIQLLIKEKGGTREQYHLLLDKIAYHESKGDPTIHQKGGGPGRGLYQFEEGDTVGGKTASNRLIRYLSNNKKQIPKWLKDTKKGLSVDASKLTSDQQSMMFLGNMREHPTANLANLWNGKQSIEDFWVKYHWAGDDKDEFDRRKSFKADAKVFDAQERKVPEVPSYKPSSIDTLKNIEARNLIQKRDNIPTPHNYKLDLNKVKIPIVNNKFSEGGKLNQQDLVGEFNEFNEGGKHEQNPYGGIPMGIGQNGQMNTVEQEETSYQFDEGKYIFSERLTVNDKNNINNTTKNKFAKGGMMNGHCGGEGQPPCPDTLVKKDNINVIKPLKVKNRLMDPKNFLLNYIQSDIYKNKIKNSKYKNVDKEIKDRLNNIKNTEVIYQKNKLLNFIKGKRISDSGSNYSKIDKSIVVDPKQLKELNTSYNSVLSHEFAHAELDSGNPKINRLNKNDKSELFNRNKNKFPLGHNNAPDENKADLNALRYQLYKEGLYNNIKEGTFTKEHLKLLKNSFIKKRLLNNYTEEDLIWLMNNIASNTKQINNNIV